MQEINEAYEVLSDAAKRKEYDDLQGSGTQEAGDFFRVETESEPEYDTLREDWKIVLEYYPELEKHLNSLSRISWKLRNTFKSFMLDSKEYEKGGEIFSQIHEEFLETYFWNNISIIKFAEKLIKQNKKKPFKRRSSLKCHLRTLTIVAVCCWCWRLEFAGPP